MWFYPGEKPGEDKMNVTMRMDHYSFPVSTKSKIIIIVSSFIWCVCMHVYRFFGTDNVDKHKGSALLVSLAA